MIKYSWKKYNQKSSQLSRKLVKFNNENNFNFIEDGLYNHIRDIFCLSILIKKRGRIKILDYGSNILSLSNIKNKINVKKYDFFIFDPFLEKKKIIYSPFKIQIYNDKFEIKKEFFDIINFGSSIQYLKKLSDLDQVINFKKTLKIIITHTPITVNKKFISKQSNHINLQQKIFNYYDLIKFFKKKKFSLIFKSRNETKYAASLKNKSSTFSLNLVFEKDVK